MLYYQFALIITKPTQRMLINHFKEIAKVGIDVILYNVPSRTGVNLEGKSTIELSKVENIKAIKEATGNIEQMIEICNNTENFDVLSREKIICVTDVRNRCSRELFQ